MPLRVRPEASRAPPRPPDGDRLDEPARARELLRRHRGKVLRPQQLVLAPRAEARLPAVDLGPRPGRRALAALTVERRRPGGELGLHGGTEEPRVVCAIERLEILPARDERLAQRPVDVVLAGELDDREAFQRVGDPAGADLEARLAQHPAEGDDVPDYGISGHERWRPARRAS